MPWHFPALELLFIGLGLFTLGHALRAHRAGEPSGLRVWLVAVAYGLTMEILSYNFIDSFTHAQFTVMLYGGQLPLYIVFLYPLFLYTGWAIARSMQLGALAEGVAAGLIAVCMDLPFDVLGPALGWWTWSATDPNVAYRWAGVPVTSYLWHFKFGGALVFLCGRVERRPLLLPLVPVGAIVLGGLLFVPFHIATRAGLDAGLYTGVVFAAAVAFVALRDAGTREATGLRWLLPAYYPLYAALCLLHPPTAPWLLGAMAIAFFLARGLGRPSEALA